MVSNFELRMLAEVLLYWTMYECLSTTSAGNLPDAQARLYAWKKEWGFLFGKYLRSPESLILDPDPALDQPRSQFLQMGFYFAQLLMYDLSLKSKSAAVQESLISEMSTVSTAIIRLAIETSDERTPHLTDHIYHMIAFSAVTLCRLLHVYEAQITISHKVEELDSLIIELTRWLHTIGLPCHIAYILGNVVSAFHGRLRPDAHFTATPNTDLHSATPQDLSFFFPELLGMESLGDTMQDLLPDWEPLTSFM